MEKKVFAVKGQKNQNVIDISDRVGQVRSSDEQSRERRLHQRSASRVNHLNHS